jgi:hypothetical protein
MRTELIVAAVLGIMLIAAARHEKNLVHRFYKNGSGETCYKFNERVTGCDPSTVGQPLPFGD